MSADPLGPAPWDDPEPIASPLDVLPDLPEIVVPKPITGNGIVAIRGWVCAVSQAYDPRRDRALVQYASWIGYYANLKTFRVEITDRDLAEQLGTARTRLSGHHRRLQDDGFLMRTPRKRGETGTPYVLSTLVTL